VVLARPSTLVYAGRRISARGRPPTSTLMDGRLSRINPEAVDGWGGKSEGV